MRTFLFACCALLLLTIAVQLIFGGGQHAPATIRAKPISNQPAKVDAALEFKPAGTYSEFVQRPLFNNTRRPLVVEVEAPAEPKVDPKQSSSVELELSGVTIAGVLRVALIRNKKDKQYHHVKEGEVFLGWTLDQVQSDRVMVSNAQSKLELAIVRQGTKKQLQGQQQQRAQARARTLAQRKKAQARARARRGRSTEEAPEPDDEEQQNTGREEVQSDQDEG